MRWVDLSYSARGPKRSRFACKTGSAVLSRLHISDPACQTLDSDIFVSDGRISLLYGRSSTFDSVEGFARKPVCYFKSRVFTCFIRFKVYLICYTIWFPSKLLLIMNKSQINKGKMNSHVSLLRPPVALPFNSWHDFVIDYMVLDPANGHSRFHPR